MARKAKNSIRITGRVLDRKTEQGVPNLRVEAWDKDAIIDDFVGSDVTGERGVFEIKFDQSHFRELFSDKQPDLYFKVFSDDKLIKSTEKSVLWNVKNPETEIVIEVNMPAEKPEPDGKPQPFKVAGLVRRFDGAPLVGTLVRAFDKDLRSEECLNETTTDEAGRYEITYTAAQFRRAEKGSADLRISVCNEDGRELVSSAIIFNARPEETVDLTVGGEYRGPSEYEAMIAEITPVLQGVPLHELTEQDVAFLAGDTGLEAQRLTWLAESARRHQEADSILPLVFYGLMRQNLPSDLPGLLNQDMDVLRRALETSIRDNVIPLISDSELDEIMAELLVLKTSRMLQPAEEDEAASFGDLLRTVMPSPDKQKVLADLFVRHRGTSAEFWQAVGERDDFSAEEIKQVQTTLQLGTLTGNHLSLVSALQRMGHDDPALQELRGFARLEEADWMEVIQRRQSDDKIIGFPADTPGATDEEKIANYAGRLNQFIENAFPTAVLANKLDKDTRDNSPFREMKVDFKTFFTRNPDFEFGATPVDLYLGEDRDQKLEGVHKPDEFTAQLKSMQRVLKITPRFEQISALMADGLHSSQAIVLFGRNRFVEKYGEFLGGAVQAELAYGKAEQIQDMALMLYAKHSAAFNSPMPYVIAGDSTGAKAPRMLIASTSENGAPQTATAGEAKWRTLFGSIDLCDCEHCKSAYSPAAYLVDILKFLKDGKEKNGQTPLQVLLQRRPDLAHIELTCENTNTPVPYVDLVNEVLEEALVPFVPVGHWKFDEGQGTTAGDASGNGNNGTLNGPTWSTGKIGTGALSFDGSDDYVQIGAAPELALTDTGTICAWIHPKGLGSVSSRGTIIAKEGEYVVSWSLSPKGGAIDWRFPNRQPRENWHAAGGFIAPINEWTHIVIVFDKGNVKTYANGQLVDDAAGTGSIGLAGAQPKDITIGGRPNLVEYFFGHIDDVRLYDRALSAEEVRASAVARPARQTRGTAEELASNPEHINIAAYDKLHEAVYPWSLPFNLWAEEARTYLNHLGVKRHEVMETCFKGVPSAALIDIAIAREYLGLTSEEAKIITGATTGGLPAPASNSGAWNFWGFSKEDIDPIPDPLDSSKTISGNWIEVLKRVDLFLQQSDLRYKELLELLGTYFINSTKAGGSRTLSLVAIEKDAVGDPVDPATCDLSKLNIDGLDESALKKIYRFVRLWRKLGWAMRDLDKAITALKTADLNDDFLTQLSHIQRLRSDLKVQLVNMLSWWADIDTANYIDYQAEGQPEVKSFYEQLFLNKAVINPVDEAFELNSARDELRNPSSAANHITINSHIPTVTAALGIGAADLSLLLGITPSIPQQEVTAVVNGLGLDRTRCDEPMFVLDLGTVASADNRFTIKFQESNDDGAYSDIPNADLQGGGQPAVIDQNNDDQVIRRRYLGKKKFLRVAVTAVQGSQPRLPISAYLVLGNDKVSDELNLANLSLLYRISSLAKALKLSIRDYLSVRQLTGIDPFNAIPATNPLIPATGATLRFVEKVGVIRTSSFSIADLDYLLRHEFPTSSALAPTEEASALILNDIRNGLQKISAENTFIVDPSDPNGVTADPNGELAKKKLALLNWDSMLAEQVVATLNDAVTYRAKLSDFPKIEVDAPAGVNISVPAGLSALVTFDAATQKLSASQLLTSEQRRELLEAQQSQPSKDILSKLFDAQDKIASLYDFSKKELRFVGGMTVVGRDTLKQASDTQAFGQAVETLFDAPRIFVSRAMRTFSVQNFSEPLAGLPAKVEFSNTLKNKVYYDSIAQRLHFIGVMTETERESLLSLSSDASDPNHGSYQAAVNLLFDAPGTLAPQPEDGFHDVAALFDNPTIPEARFDLVLKRLIPYLRRTLSEILVKQKLGEALKLESKTAEELLLKWMNSPAHSAQKCIADFLAPAFAESSLNVNLTAAAFPDQFMTFTLLQKVAMLVTKSKITAKQLAWLFEYWPAAGWLDLNALPLAQTNSAFVLFAGWERLADLFRLRDQLPSGESVLADVFNMARDGKTTLTVFLQKLSERTRWDLDDLQFLVGVQGFGFTYPDAFKDERALLRLQACFKLMKRLGASAKQLSEWGKTNQTAAEELDNARSIKNAAKAKYDDKQWLAVAKPLKNQLREKQRAALVACLVARDHLHDASELYEHYLIDVEMSPCMMTTRIKQAISSVQLFIQRCLMNLEAGVSLSPKEAQEWGQWRKQYRVWEANRKVFLYPENWIEPELRDDKSPFFKDLENELLQNDVTMDTAETAFRHYLEKLDEVARLDIVGMYHQKEEDIDILHVFGRTYSIPHIYYYRKLEKSVWSAWERVDVDIEGDHLIPVVWNRRLYLFWPIFTKKAMNGITVGAGDESPAMQWEIQLAWSQNRMRKWTARSTSSAKVTIESKRFGDNYYPYKLVEQKAITFKARTEVDGDLIITLLYLSAQIENTHQMESAIITQGLEWRSFRLTGCEGGITTQSGFDSNKTESLFPNSHIEFMSFVENSGEYPFSNPGGRGDSILSSTPGIFRLLAPHQDVQFTFQSPFFYQDDRRTYFVPQDLEFAIHFHPRVCDFIKSLNRAGIPGLLSRQNQQLTDLGSVFWDKYDPAPLYFGNSGPKEDVDFEYQSAYSQYNWELFFHAPFLIATRLSNNQHFDEARKWFHYIFDPTTSESGGPERFWKVKPFYEETKKHIQTLDELMNEAKALEEQVKQWEENPFKPHVIARLRIVAYMKAVVMKYIDNLIAWGDQLFRRDTIESINEATQLYILAAQILGKRPEEIPPRAVPETQTFNSLTTKEDLKERELDSFVILTEIDNFIFPSTAPNTSSTGGTSSLGRMPLFCIPKNDKLLGYWGTVADRLFKIRHCMNIEGVVRQLPLFEPPIDPALLVRAAAAGVDISSALSDINAALPHYRFNVMVQKATELCNDVKALGGALLSALEKRDAEALALMRSRHEVKLLNAVRQIKEQQVKETKEALEGLNKSRGITETRESYYRNLPYTNPQEQLHINKLAEAHRWQTRGQILELAAATASLIPGFDAGVSGAMGSPVVKLRFGGLELGASLNAASRAISLLASLANHEATKASIKGGWDRRAEDWKFQADLAKKELEQTDKQILAAQIRVAIAEHELKNHDLQVENAEEVKAFMQDKFTNQELYDWMVGQISSLYFQSYQMAYDMAKRAERAYRHELSLSDSSFIQFGYWDSLKKGLLAGEKLHYDLKRMEMAYMDQNKREYELTKHVSLAMLDPIALLALKETGECFVDLPEALFDLDYPGHYMRRLKSVSLTIPCVVGPYTGVNCTLTLLRNSVRKNAAPKDNEGNYARKINANSDDPRFADNIGTIQSIATSNAQNDSGVFELNFRDERYLPFEGAGAISSWRIELSKDKDLRQFDYDTISDIVFHVKYTARDGGDALKTVAVDSLKSLLFAAADAGKSLVRLFSARHEFPSEWHKFLHPKDTDKEQTLQLELTSERFPFQFQTKTIKISQMELFLKLQETLDYEDAQPLRFDLKRVGGTEFPAQEFKVPGSPITDLPHVKPFEKKDEVLGKWLIDVDREGGDANTETDTEMDTDSEVVACIPPCLRLKDNDDNYVVVEIGNKIYYQLNPDAIEDIVIVVQYSVTSQEKTTDVTNTQ